ncbi:MAG: HdeD family acid-resistance protein [Renibacterium sp.]|nr:HdeD family acid-resistance protein [Renibacterium sp.]
MTEVYTGSRQLWWLVLLRGIFAVFLGLYAWFSPGTTIIVLIIVFGFYAIVDGISAVVIAIGSRGKQRLWGWLIVEGIVSVLAGIVALALPDFSALAVGFLIGFWALLLGILQIAESVMLRRSLGSVWVWLLVTGIIVLIWGIFVLSAPGAGLLTVLWIFGLFAVLFGISKIAMSFRIRSAVKSAG